MIQSPFEVENHGMTLRGMVYRPDRPGRHPVALLLHRFGGHRIETGFLFTQIARTLVQRGIATVAFDFRHSGESDGSFDQMLTTGQVDDAVRVMHWLYGQMFADRSRIGVLGYSLGGLVAACLAARVNSVRSMILLAPTTGQHLRRYVDQTLSQPQVTVGPHTLHPDFFADLQTLDELADCTRNPRPTLVIHGSGDKTVPAEVCQQYVDAMTRAGVPVTQKQIAGANHSFSEKPWRAELLPAIADHFAQTLG